ncbi:glycosyltransferase family 2 protein [Lichenicola cladoniae]|uniref:Glycosyltransferase family 2 protein n=1 Tax=Lichenicola cladoniae TaxID=1484109 RepID=A0A6M8HE38_9PROT|nr:glycosyltransferase family 2 protein [Lichenicola cladoniae]NPD66721.1 glycosyltransferase family 2 protein [Acetobacteraceae bacterium]QKE88670.1 glycosyltransferase family 2 protein [Lichenicola cladoniae]
MIEKEKIGLVVVLKDEVHDIAAWLAWHIALGFDTILVIDDASTDGTDRIVRNVGLHFDVRYEKVLQDFDFFYDRQQNEYKKAIARLKSEFSWLCFLDADEYLLLESAPSVPQFLESFPEADGIAVNWRLHGNNGHVLRPLVPAPVAYPMRSHSNEAINRHVKSFVRPTRVGTGWHNVHCFDISPPLYLNTIGKPIKWSSTPGIVHGEPVFSGAWIMHFQNRSMEHFIDRAKKRRDTLIVAQIWNNESWNAESDDSASRFFTAMFRVLAKIELQISSALCGMISTSIKPPNFSVNYSMKPTKPVVKSVVAGKSIGLITQKVITYFNTSLQVDPNSDLIIHSSETDQRSESLYLIRPTNSDADALMVCPTHGSRPLRLRGDRQAGTVIQMQVGLTPEGLTTFRSPATRLFLTAEPPGIGTGNQVSCDRKVVKNWEMFSLLVLDSDTVDQAVTQMAQSYFELISRGLTASSLCKWISESPRSASSTLLQILLRQLSKSEKLHFSTYLPASTPLETLVNNSQYS